MPTNFPGSNDSFGVPSTPATTALGSAGDSARNMVNNHGDLGAAVMAMQAEATYVNHTHDGSFRNGSKLAQANTHQSVDTDTATTALHHTIGTGANQGAAGNHTHGAPNTWPLHSIFITEQSGDPAAIWGLPGTWTQINGFFLVAAGSTFTGGTTGGAATHTHTPTFTSAGGHSHTSPNTDNAGSHSHGNSGGSGTSTIGHTHDNSNSNNAASVGIHYANGSGTSAMTQGSHFHQTLSAGSSGSSTSHNHSVASSSSVGDHNHTISGTDTQGAHSHTSGMTTDSHIPPYLSVYVWERTA